MRSWRARSRRPRGIQRARCKRAHRPGGPRSARAPDPDRPFAGVQEEPEEGRRDEPDGEGRVQRPDNNESNAPRVSSRWLCTGDIGARPLRLAVRRRGSCPRKSLDRTDAYGQGPRGDDLGRHSSRGRAPTALLDAEREYANASCAPRLSAALCAWLIVSPTQQRHRPWNSLPIQISVSRRRGISPS
jgi:hypothetical protein